MWGIFLESVVIFKNYVGYHQNKFLFGLFLFFLKGKNRKKQVFYLKIKLPAVEFYLGANFNIQQKRYQQDHFT